MSETQSLMLTEAGQSPEVVATLLEKEKPAFAEIAKLFSTGHPSLITTAARGSSDHAATFFKYLFEISCGIPVASVGPSIASVYGAPLHLKGGIHFTVSQSGGSPDIIALQAAAKKGGATTIAVVNVTDSPLAKEADIVLGLNAGKEQSVAATKSFIASVAALAGVTAAVSQDKALIDGLAKLPEALAATSGIDGRAAEDVLFNASSLYTGGRGPAFAIALEAALKAKETAGLHAEAFSLAELMHGPMRLVQPGFPIVAFSPDDAAFANNAQALERLQKLGATAVSFSTAPLAGINLRMPTTGNGLLDPLVSLLCYYRLIESVTRRKGFDPDKPANLLKVTETM
ncbi:MULTISPECIES: SIS domain-containing protein [Rhizobium]|uniref:Glucosamine--fructose-6-phosphate aminotransferase (Isomerizing) n=1 Tax=Rhizobium tropici TaxID=398 RepID=A0A6P1C1W3_RHITR|nr:MULTISPECIES: SIS domain-containing protein [Rhizobium]AGB72942.1 glucosamine--fructose-6-phosphate aminotransferase protein [Rhizobium tropici CIAT 899]MBB4241242.1 glucosamine--fructose-6-phosphate aminotransferase (isomerizing) [Rhizobium tropici]MBB5592212.1 glucosamine--fructose-6-phosphate aminotransferase (isomerizing) [Rhizobium tropici]MBB6491567.1 glucosamine--fructose-6-phosphate aminotransferase (isomerizing) [Rhizobium tropici]NEV10386.1 SIS domain-containing protein [Rhizobium